MSFACACSPPGVSTMKGTPAVAGCLSRQPNAAVPICPAPMFSCRSLRDPQRSFESLA